MGLLAFMQASPYCILSIFIIKQKEKEIKIHRRQLEKKWREEISQLDQQREQEGHGKIELGVGHALALGPPTDDNLPGNFLLNNSFLSH